MPRYSMGFDFGSLSVRSVLVDVDTGEEIGTAVYEYPHGIMEDCLPDGTKIPNGFVLQHPQDYLDGLRRCSCEVLAKSCINADHVIGIGIDSTASTVLPLGRDREPLCFKEEYQSNPHAWLKLWKHRGDIDQAERITELASRRQEHWLKRRGGILSCEFFLPKALEIAECGSDIYDAADSIIEVADWLTEKLTGTPCRSQALAESNGCYLRGIGYPADDFYAEASGNRKTLDQSRLREPVVGLKAGAGVLNKYGAEMLGLREGTAVAVPLADAHASVSASGASQLGDMVYICGTSAVELLLTDHPVEIPGIHISGQDISVPDYCSVGCGQSCVGDAFSWFVNTFVPKSYHDLSAECGTDIFSFLSEKAANLQPGESGLVAIDWWNGARTPFFNFELTGFIFGMSLHTKPEHVWRALFEAHAFNVKKCITMLTGAGHTINRIFATGGIPAKNPVLMQIISDVIQKDIYICKSPQPSALGSAIFGAAAALKEEPFSSVMERMCSKPEKVYHPSKEHYETYCKLYEIYNALTETYGRSSRVLQELRQIKNSAIDRQVT